MKMTSSSIWLQMPVRSGLETDVPRQLRRPQVPSQCLQGSVEHSCMPEPPTVPSVPYNTSVFDRKSSSPPSSFWYISRVEGISWQLATGYIVEEGHARSLQLMSTLASAMPVTLFS
ncbi:uncharacterized protein LOC108957692 [Eucalyptus grandis]|uniref:uncharacterized protein LOC108957692 n=1 Tax=Eucalyptus grandis TaxID=71139 RepID=UPI00192E8886|nr:uncharacterized protein LOC108957692 [Eucalyptus grandis]